MKKENSQFYSEMTQALEKAMEKRTDDDCMLMLLADSKSNAHIIGGNASTLYLILLDFMRKNPAVANLVCSAAIEWHIQAMQQPILKVAPVPEDGVAEWPQHGMIIGIDKGLNQNGNDNGN